jgi:hypothetical protein
MSYGGMGYGGYRGMGMYVNPEQFASGFSAATTIGQALNIENAQREQGVQSQQEQYALQGAEMDQNLKRTSYNNAMIANAARTAGDDPVAWDTNFKALQDKGITEAGQFVGRYSPAMAERVTNGYDETAGLARGSRPSSSIADAQSPDYDRMFAGQTPEQMAKVADTSRRAMDLLSGVHDQESWDAAKAAAIKGGMDPRFVAALGPYNPIQAKRLYDHFLQTSNYLSGRMAGEMTGEPEPLVPSKTVNIGDSIYSLNENTSSGIASATEIAHVPESQFVGIDPKTGHAIYHDQRPMAGGGPQETEGIYDVQPKGYGMGGSFEAKKQAWLAANPGDIQGALNYANPSSNKRMTAQQQSIAADKLAQADYGHLVQNEASGGPPAPTDMNAYIKQRTEYYKGQLAADNAPQSNVTGPGGAQGGPVAKGQMRGTDGQTYDVTGTLANAKAAISRNPSKKAAIIGKLKKVLPGINTAGL